MRLYKWKVDEEQGCQDDYVKTSKEGGGSCFWKHLNSLTAMLWARVLFRKYFSHSLNFVSELKHSFSIKKQIIKCRTSISGTNMTSVVFFFSSFCPVVCTKVNNTIMNNYITTHSSIQLHWSCITWENYILKLFYNPRLRLYCMHL